MRSSVIVFVLVLTTFYLPEWSASCLAADKGRMKDHSFMIRNIHTTIKDGEAGRVERKTLAKDPIF
jgi:hypothetical protein